MVKNNLLEIKNLCVSIDDKNIINDFSLVIPYGQTHVIMGQNGVGKSTLSKVLLGHPHYKILSGTMELNGKDIIKMPIDKRVHAGISLSFQYPFEISGFTNLQFLYSSYSSCKKAKKEEILSLDEFDKKVVDKYMDMLQIPKSFKHRGVNEGFSGGEKKINEILQMLVLDHCQLIILDEIDERRHERNRHIAQKNDE